MYSFLNAPQKIILRDLEKKFFEDTDRLAEIVFLETQKIEEKTGQNPAAVIRKAAHKIIGQTFSEKESFERMTASEEYGKLLLAVTKIIANTKREEFLGETHQSRTELVQQKPGILRQRRPPFRAHNSLPPVSGKYLAAEQGKKDD